MSPASSRDPRASQVVRVETLLAAVQDMVSSLRTVSDQLSREICVLTEQSGTEVGATRTDLEVLRTENSHLKEALQGRSIIERAKGMLMAKYGCAEEAAFQMLVSVSREERRKVRDVAADMATMIPTARTGEGAADRPGQRAR
ncbi:MAG: ANTAR domain-containing protein [Actinobacteria bacterium]|nr:ANTAR domain-containing protein [Actinomycetota bacterium]